MPVLLQTIILLCLSNLFMTFAVFYMRQSMRLDFLWAGLCLCGAVYFVFRGEPAAR